MDTTRQVPAHALRFDAAPIALAPVADDAAAPRQFEGVAYSGEVVRNHYFWGNVVFDLASTRAPDRLPILIEHDRKQRAGFGSTVIADSISISGTLLANAHGQAIASESDAGFPWQMSVHIEPGRVETIEPGTHVTVNGRELSGPLTVFRDSLIRETSFSPTGADPHTSARAFADADMRDIPVTTFTEDHPMGVENTDLVQRIDALESQLSAASTRADTAEAALTEFHASARTGAITALFAATGGTPDEAQSAQFAAMTDAQFAAVDAAMRAAAPVTDERLFAEHATRYAVDFT